MMLSSQQSATAPWTKSVILHFSLSLFIVSQFGYVLQTQLKFAQDCYVYFLPSAKPNQVCQRFQGFWRLLPLMLNWTDSVDNNQFWCLFPNNSEMCDDDTEVWTELVGWAKVIIFNDWVHCAFGNVCLVSFPSERSFQLVLHPSSSTITSLNSTLLSVLWFCIYCAQPFFLLPIQPPWFTAPPSSYVQLLAEGSFTALRVPVFYSFQFNASSVSLNRFIQYCNWGNSWEGIRKRW